MNTLALTEQQRQQILADWVPMPRYQLRCWVVRRLIRQFPAASFVEIGAAAGDMAEWLSRRGMRGVATEISPSAIRLLEARFEDRPQVTIHPRDAADLDIQTDLVLAMEVLEHIEDDRATLQDWFRLVRPGGRLIISVPAHPHLFSAEDEMAGHFRRYSKRELQDKLKQAGFDEIDVLAYGFPLGLVLKQLRTLISRWRMREDRRSRLERTCASGVDRRRAARFRWLLSGVCLLPFNLMQMPFLKRDWSDGYIAIARRPDSRA